MAVVSPMMALCQNRPLHRTSDWKLALYWPGQWRRHSQSPSHGSCVYGDSSSLVHVRLPLIIKILNAKIWNLQVLFIASMHLLKV